MNTLQSPPVVATLTRLFAEAEQTTAELHRRVAALPPAQLRATMGDPNADYRALYALARDIHMAVAPATARLLYMLARGAGARSIVEFGTSFGISTIHLAAALRDNGGGRVIGSEFEPAKVAVARANLAAAGLADLVEIREGDARESLARDLPDAIDLVLLDGHKGLYPHMLELLGPRLRPGAWIVADDAGASPAYLARVRDPAGPYVSIEFADDIEVSLVHG